MDYKINASRISMREFFWETPLFGWIGLFVKIFKPRVNGSTDDLAVESLTPYETTLESIPVEAQQKFAPIFKKLEAAGFEPPILWHLEYNAIQSTQNVIATLRHKSGRAWVRLQRRTNFARTPAKIKQFITFVSSTLDGQFIVTGNGKYDMAWPKTHNVLRFRKLLSEKVWEQHQQRMPQSVKILRPDELRDEAEWYHETLRDFQVKRGVFVPLTEEDKAVYSEPPPSAGPAPLRPNADAPPVEGGVESYQASPSSPAGDAMESAVLTELRVLQNKKVNWKTSILLLVISGLLFAANARGSSDAEDRATLLIIVGVLLVHETGHYLAMKLFGYRNLRMFFLPGFGAAVSGRHYNAPAWKKILVSLMGPLPGILIGTACCIASLPMNNDLLYKAGLFALIINAFNLIPVLPLDGGWVAHAAIFSRSPMLDVGFRIVAAVALIGMGLWLPGFKVLPYLGVAALLGLPIASRNAKIVKELRQEHGRAPSPDDQSIPPNVARVILAKIRGRTKRTLHARTAAQQVTQIFETLNARPPSAGATLGLLSLHAGGFVFALVVGVGMIALHNPLIAARLRGGSLTANSLVPKNAMPDEVITRGPKFLTGPHDTIIATYADEKIASQQLVKIIETLPVESFGQTLLVQFKSSDAQGEEVFILSQEKTAVSVAKESETFKAVIWCDAKASSVEEAQEIVDELNGYSELMHLERMMPPWSNSLEWPTEKRAEVEIYRTIYHELESGGKAGLYPSNLEKELSDAENRGDTNAVDRINKQISDGNLAARNTWADQVAAKYGHTEFIKMWRTAVSEADYQNELKLKRKNLCPFLGRLPSGFSDDALKMSGEAARRGSEISIFDLQLIHTDTGFVSLCNWLRSKGCKNIRYEITGMRRYESDKSTQTSGVSDFTP